MRLQVIYNSHTAVDGMKTGWGLSCLIDGHILFDTGESGEALLYNLKVLAIDPESIDTVVISHEHWDHTGGLWDLLKIRSGLTVHACPGFSEEFFKKVKDSGAHVQLHNRMGSIAVGVSVTGEMSTTYKGQPLVEQSLIIQNERGITVLCGCAHPGVVLIMEQVGRDCPGVQIDTVIGGFHLNKTDIGAIEQVVAYFRKIGVQRVGPTHCSGAEAERLFGEEYTQGDFITFNVGEEINI